MKTEAINTRNKKPDPEKTRWDGIKVYEQKKNENHTMQSVSP